jgi:hypothetical protein
MNNIGLLEKTCVLTDVEQSINMTACVYYFGFSRHSRRVIYQSSSIHIKANVCVSICSRLTL